MGELDLAFGRLDRAGERALLVAEQFGLEQILGNGGAVDGDEAAGPAAALLVDSASEQLLAGAAGAKEHHRDIGIGHALDRARHPHHLRRGGHHVAKDGAGLADLAFQAAILGFDVVKLKGPADDQAELINVDRLLIEIVGTGSDRPQGAFARAMSGGDDHLCLGLQRQDVLERGKAFAHAVRVGGKAEVERDHGGFRRANQAEGRIAVGSDQHLVIVIGPSQLTLQALVILDDQQLGFYRHVHARIRS